MATSEGTVSLVLTKQTRTWRTNIESTFKQKPVLTAHRQTIGVDGSQNKVTDEGAPGVGRVIDSTLLGDKTQNQVTLANGTVIQLAEVAEAIPLFIDLFAAKDKAVEDVRLAAEAKAKADAEAAAAQPAG